MPFFSFAGGKPYYVQPDEYKSLDDVPETEIVDPEDEEVLLYNPSTAKWYNGNNSPSMRYLNDLNDVTAVNVKDKQVLKYESASGFWKYDNVNNRPELKDTGNVTLTNPILDDTIVYNGSGWVNQPRAHTIEQMTDTDIQTPENQQLLTYNISSWTENTPDAGTGQITGLSSVATTGTLSSLTDVVITSPTDGQLLYYNGI